MGGECWALGAQRGLIYQFTAHKNAVKDTVRTNAGVVSFIFVSDHDRDDRADRVMTSFLESFFLRPSEVTV